MALGNDQLRQGSSRQAVHSGDAERSTRYGNGSGFFGQDSTWHEGVTGKYSASRPTRVTSWS